MQTEHRAQWTPSVAAALLVAACTAPPPGFQGVSADWDDLRVRRVAAPPRALDETADLADLLRHARAHNPGLEAAFQRWRAALERVPQAIALPEPRLTLGAYLSEVETRVGPMQARVGLTQPFPWFGTLEAAGHVALEAAEAAREGFEAARLDLDQKVRDAWYELYWLEQAIEITEGHRELLAHWESVARARLETGIGPYSDVIRAQVELGKLEDRVLTLTDLRRPIGARLNAALNRPSNAPLPRSTRPLPEPPPFEEERLMAELASSSPLLRALAHHVEAARFRIELAQKEFYPGFQLGIEYAFVGPARSPGVSDSGDDALAVGLGLELPVWRSSYRAGLRQAESGLKSARKDREETWRRLSADLEMALYGFRDANRRVRLFRDSLIPKGEESVQALDIAYQAGDEGFLDLIDAQRVLLEFQLQTARAEADRAQALAETERITAIPLRSEP